MYLENLVVDAVEPQRLGRFWEAVVGGERLTDEPDGFETRVTVDGGPVLDLCFQRVPEPAVEPQRLHLNLSPGAGLDQEVDRLLALGAQRVDTGRSDEPWVVLADPEGYLCRVVEQRAARAGSGPIVGLALDSADPDKDAEFWSWLTGWTDAAGVAPRSLRHGSLLGPSLELCPESVRKGATKNRLHLDLRLETGDDPEAVAAGIAERGGGTFEPEWSGLVPWRMYIDPSGNEFCVLPARA
jgi:hypothetical protein